MSLRAQCRIIGRFKKKSDNSTTGLLQPESNASSASGANQYLQIYKRDQVTMGGVLDHIQS
jgi:hypothetical protein